MNENVLPRASSIGAQLAVGVQSACLYIPTGERGEGSTARWIEARAEQLSIDLGNLCLSDIRYIIDDSSPSHADKSETESELDGSDIISDFDDDDENDDEAFEHWRGILLSKLSWGSLSPVMPPNLQYFKEVEFGDDHMYDVRYHQAQSPNDFVPESLISDLTHGDFMSRARSKSKLRSRSLSSFDPIVGDLFVTCDVQTASDLRNGNNQHQIIAYSSGKTNSVLKLAILKRKQLNNTKAPLPDEVRGLTSIELRSTIKSIKVPKIATLLDRKSDLIGIMTESALHIVKIENINPHTLEIRTSICEALPFIEFGDFPYADFAFNPWDTQQFAVVDVRGNFGLGRLPRPFRDGSKARLLQDFCGSIFDPEELSNWKKIEWSSSFTRLIVMDRSKMIELDFELDWQLEVIQAKTWSRLLDYRKFDDDFGVLLTNREIIVISTSPNREQLTREISWKHDLDAEDSTFRLCVQKIVLVENTLLLACVFSRNHSQLYTHCFSISRDGSLVQTVGDSAILQIPQVSRGLREVTLYDGTDIHDEQPEAQGRNSSTSFWLDLFVHENDSEQVLSYVLSNNQEITSQDTGIFKGDLPNNKVPNLGTTFSTSEAILKIIGQIKEKSITHRSPFTSEIISDEDIFQDYGYRLSEAINQVIISWSSCDYQDLFENFQPLIKDIAELPGDFKSISECSSLMQQLFRHYEDQGIVFTKFNTISSILLRESIEELDVFYNKLLQCWDLVTADSESLTRDVLRDVVWSFLRFFKPQLYESAEANLRESLSKSYVQIVDSWGNVDLELEHSQSAVSSSRLQFPADSQSQIPTIKSSQPRSSRNRRRATGGLSNGRVMKSSSAVPQSGRATEVLPPLLSSSQTSGTLPDRMTPAFTLMQPTGSSFFQSQSSQRSRRKKKRVGGFG